MWETCQWCIQNFFGNTVFSRGFWGRSPKWHNRDFGRIIFSYKLVWIAWIGIVYYVKSDNYVLIKCIRHCARGDFIQYHFKFFSFLLIWDKNLRSHTGWPVAASHWTTPACFEKSKVLNDFINDTSKSGNMGFYSRKSEAREGTWHFILSGTFEWRGGWEKFKGVWRCGGKTPCIKYIYAYLMYLCELTGAK